MDSLELVCFWGKSEEKENMMIERSVSETRSENGKRADVKPIEKISKEPKDSPDEEKVSFQEGLGRLKQGGGEEEAEDGETKEDPRLSCKTWWL